MGGYIYAVAETAATSGAWAGLVFCKQPTVPVIYHKDIMERQLLGSTALRTLDQRTP